MAITLQPATDAPAKDLRTQLTALLAGAAVAPLDEIGWIRVTGADRVRWLNGMVTNAIESLKAGAGCYNFVLNAQGRILGDLTAFALPDSLLLETTHAGSIATHLDHFIIMDDVELTVLRNGRGERESAISGGHPFLIDRPEREGILIAGPQALRTVQELGGNPCSAPPPDTPNSARIDLKQTKYRGKPIDLIRAYGPLVPRFEIWADRETMAQITAELVSVPKVSQAALEQLRILSGTPRYGTDIRDRELPQETCQTRALHFSKGCYLGQEIVERIRSRGNVHRTFGGFELEGALPGPGTVLEAEGKPVGELTSVAKIELPESSALPSVQLALGYVRREVVERGIPLEYPGGRATPVALPYRVP